MQVIFKDEDERSNSGRTSIVDAVICTGRISECLEGKCFGEFGGGNTRI